MAIAARIRSKRARIIEHRWRGCDRALRGQFKVCCMERIQKRMIEADPLQGIFLPTPAQMIRLHRGEKFNAY